MPNAIEKTLAVIEDIEKGGIGGNPNSITVAIEVIARNLYTITKEWSGLAQSITTDLNFLSGTFSTGTGTKFLAISKTVAADEEKPSGVLISWLFTCEPLRSPMNQNINSLISYMEIPSLRAFYVQDGNNIDGFYNEANPNNYNPVMILGAIPGSLPSVEP